MGAAGLDHNKEFDGQARRYGWESVYSEGYRPRI
jgi:hypothetical protein